MSHVAKEHGKWVHEESAIIYSITLIAPEFRREDQNWQAGLNGRGGGSRTGGGGRGGYAAGPVPSGGRKEKDDLSSSASSPLKSTDDHSPPSSALKRRLEFTEKGKGDQLALTQGKGEDG